MFFSSLNLFEPRASLPVAFKPDSSHATLPISAKFDGPPSTPSLRLTLTLASVTNRADRSVPVELRPNSQIQLSAFILRSQDLKPAGTANRAMGQTTKHIDFVQINLGHIFQILD